MSAAGETGRSSLGPKGASPRDCPEAKALPQCLAMDGTKAEA